jgi:anti-sigma-K factor RskA
MSAAQDIKALAGEYTLGLLESGERLAVERLLSKDPALEAEVLSWRGHFAPLDETAPAVIPSPDLWNRIEAGIARNKLAQQRERHEQGSSRAVLSRWWNSLPLWRPMGMAGALTSLILVAFIGQKIAQGPEVPQLVAVLTAPDGRAAAVVNAYTNGTVQLVPIDAIAVPEGRVLEVWTLQTRERGPVSLAQMDRARTIRLDLKGLSPAEVGHLFEITLEPRGGSPTGRPTGPVLMKGLTATRL